jgi:hypothetical protein
MSEFDDAVAFYDRHYDIIGKWFLTPGQKIMLGDPQNRACRFCGKRFPDVTFESEAHAIPEALGNKSIFSAYECDVCNNMFGLGIENDFGNWSKPMRTFARICGKGGVPCLKKGSSGGWRIEYGPSGFEITAYEEDPIFEIDEATKKVTFHLRRDPYVPVAVLKTFVKMGLTLMPPEEMVHFGSTLVWIKQPDHQVGLVFEFPVLHTFQPGPMRNDLIVAVLYRRKDTILNLPYTFFCLAYGSELFQVTLPSTERDVAIKDEPIALPQFPMPQFYKQFGPQSCCYLDLTGRTRVKGEAVTLALVFEEIKSGPIT